MNADRIESRSWICRALGRRQAYSIYQPSGTPPSGGWPVVLMLHGAGRTHRTVAENEETAKLITDCPFAVVFPDGEMSFYVDSPVVAGSKFQSMLLELLYLVRGEPGLRSDAAGTSICGWSMGGFGAVRFAEDYPEEVSTVVTLIALLDYPNPELPASQNYPLPPVLGQDPAYWQSVNCTVQAERLRGKRLAFITSQDAFDLQMNRNFHAHLDALGIPHQYAELEGSHVWATVSKAFPIMLRFLAACRVSQANQMTFMG